MEGSFVPESPFVHDRATSDDTYVPPTQRATTPIPSRSVAEPHYHIGESSCYPRLVRIPRKRVGDLPTGLLAPRDKAPTTEPEEIPQRQFPHLGWMPAMLRRWRAFEDVPSAMETGESSRPLTITGEPLELTVVTLVAVVRALFGLHQNNRILIRELSSDTSRLDGDVMSIYGRLHATDTHGEVDRHSAEATRARVDVLERHVRLACVVLGVVLGWTVLVTAAVLYSYQ